MPASRVPTRLVLLLAAAALGLAGCAEAQGPIGHGPGFFPPPPISDRGLQIDSLYQVVFWIAAAIFVLVEALLIWAVVRYRRRGDDSLPTQTHGNLVLEVIWTVIPAAIVLFLFVASMDTLAKVESQEDPPSVTVDVTGFQWQWTFDYKAEGLSFTGEGDKGPELVLPVNETVRINLHGNDVVHAFYVPQFLYKKDVVPGRVNSFDVRVEQPGTYNGQCAEFCGLAHQAMRFTMRVVPRAEYEAWVAAEQEKAKATPTPGASAGATLQVSAANAASFEQSTLEAPADTAIAIAFDNKDPAQPHNVAIKGANPDGSDFSGKPIANAGEKVTYTTPPLKAGTYTFYCAVHPNMQGTLTVK
ncbi:MAG TPA: cytochrome c oxidase subunit II [Candidatus Limnocylindrales bacterium]|nr:cytochrome c oxidase subunit II [Candidatus Limnocylindrales bacterium]